MNFNALLKQLGLTEDQISNVHETPEGISFSVIGDHIDNLLNQAQATVLKYQKAPAIAVFMTAYDDVREYDENWRILVDHKMNANVLMLVNVSEADSVLIPWNQIHHVDATYSAYLF